MAGMGMYLSELLARLRVERREAEDVQRRARYDEHGAYDRLYGERSGRVSVATQREPAIEGEP